MTGELRFPAPEQLREAAPAMYALLARMLEYFADDECEPECECLYDLMRPWRMAVLRGRVPGVARMADGAPRASRAGALLGAMTDERIHVYSDDPGLGFCGRVMTMGVQRVFAPTAWYLGARWLDEFVCLECAAVCRAGWKDRDK